MIPACTASRNCLSGTYSLTVTVPGFRTFKQVGIDLAVGRLPNIDVKLEVGAVAETVEVASDASVVDVTQSKVQVTVSRDGPGRAPAGTLLPVGDSVRCRRAQ